MESQDILIRMADGFIISKVLFPALFSLLMLIRSREGDARSKREMETWVSETGFSGIIYKPLQNISGYYRTTGMMVAFKK